MRRMERRGESRHSSNGVLEFLGGAKEEWPVDFVDLHVLRYRERARCFVRTRRGLLHFVTDRGDLGYRMPSCA